MDWLNNANTIASLIVAIVGIGGYIYGVATYLKKKASPTQQRTPVPSQTSEYTSQTPYVPYKPFSWLEWTEMLAQGIVDTVDFILGLVLQKEVDAEEIKEIPILYKVGGCLLGCFLGGMIGALLLGMIIGAFLSSIGVKDGINTGFAMGSILLFVALSFVYIYHVGVRVEKKRQEQYQETKREQQLQQSVRR